MTDLFKERQNRYRDKLDLLEERIEDVDTWLQDSNEQLLDNKERRFALYKAFQEAVEVITDICAMYLSDTGRGIGDDRDNIEKAGGALYSNEISEELGEANGLRNRVVHDYNGFDAATAVESMANILPALHKFHGEVKAWIENR
jgi:uncharacterized protein YutE (UPF0331/DUF86 family)